MQKTIYVLRIFLCKENIWKDYFSDTFFIVVIKCWFYFEKTGDRKCVTRNSDIGSGVATFFVSRPSPSIVGVVFYLTFEGYILTYIHIFWYWMTVDSEIFMPKSKAPKMDDLDYSKWTWYHRLHRPPLAHCG